MAPVLALIALLAAQTPATPAARGNALAAEPPRIDVAALLEPIRARNDMPGMVAAIVDRDGAVAIGACGVRERGRAERMTSADRMHLGSCTKSMTATLCAKLVEKGALKWTTTVGGSFADWGDAVDAGWKAVTLEQLLTHRGGVPGDVEPALWARLYTSKDGPRAQREQLARGIFAIAPAHAPATKFEYSNAGIAIAGLMAERAAEKDFEALLHDELFAPLAMVRSGFGPPGSEGGLDEPRGHRADGTPVGLGPESDNPAAIAPAGRVHASLGDWAQYAALHLRGEKEGGLDITAGTFARLHTPPKDGLDPYAMGWMALDRAWGGRVLTHSGSNTLWYCVAWLAPEKGFGVLVATNQGGDAAAKACDEASGALIQAWTKRAGAGK
ncbi:MAG: serine hydrolase [Planctomycetota bacterium]|nr:serine hydrolase [Planctomycetota bacterium]